MHCVARQLAQRPCRPCVRDAPCSFIVMAQLKNNFGEICYSLRFDYIFPVNQAMKKKFFKFIARRSASKSTCSDR
jgi:hypothetical protein